jgi:methionyl-tRNA formyltransferase
VARFLERRAWYAAPIMGVRIAVFGQAAFGKDCLDRLHAGGYEIAGVIAPPDAGKPDPLAVRTGELGLPLIRRRFFRTREGKAIPAAVAEHAQLGADLNVLAFVTAFLPREITEAPRRGSVCFHPSLLPKYRGGNALAWQIILGERESGVSVFAVDEGTDTGPIVVQKRGVAIEPRDSAGTLYFQKLYALGVDAVVEAVQQIDSGRSRPQVQDETLASFQGLVDDSVARIDLARPAVEIDRLVRGCDPNPGAFVRVRGQPLRLFDAWLEPTPGNAAPGSVVSIDAEALRLALRGGVLRVGRVRGDGGKETGQAFAERAGLRAGDRVENG